MSRSLTYTVCVAAIALAVTAVCWAATDHALVRQGLAWIAVAVVVLQSAMFAIAARRRGPAVLGGWALGAAACVAALPIAAVALHTAQVPVALPLVALCTSLFLSELLEPLLLPPS